MDVATSLGLGLGLGQGHPLVERIAVEGLQWGTPVRRSPGQAHLAQRRTVRLHCGRYEAEPILG